MVFGANGAVMSIALGFSMRLVCSKGNLLRRADVGKEIEDSEYLGAVMRLTSELSSYAITQVRGGTYLLPR